MGKRNSSPGRPSGGKPRDRSWSQERSWSRSGLGLPKTRNARRGRVQPSGPWTSFTAHKPPAISLGRVNSRARTRPREHWRQVGLVVATLLTLAAPLTLRSPGATGPDLPSEDGLSLAVKAGGTGVAAAAAQPPAPSAAGEREIPSNAQVVARFGGLQLVALNEAVRFVGFHEASYADAQALSPVGRIAFNDNPTKFAPSSQADGPDYVVLSSRGRPNAATSAVDMVVPAGVPVASVVTGTIGLVEPYLLYGRYPDTKVEIIPDARPDLKVVMIHLIDVRVVAGQRVLGGRTIIAGSANHFPFASQVDRYVSLARPAQPFGPSPGGLPGPHVHIEVKGPPFGSPPPPSGPPPAPPDGPPA